MSGIDGWARAAPERAAIITPGGATSFDELDRRQRSFVAVLTASGVRRRDRVGILSDNRPDFLAVTIGALRAGVVPVPISPRSAPAEIAYVLEDSGCTWLLCDRPVQVPLGVERVVTFGDAFDRLLHDADEGPRQPGVTQGRPMHYTSGTTGRPKGVWVDPVDETRAVAAFDRFASTWALDPDDVHLVCSPLIHSAPHRFAMRTLEAGGTVALQSRFEAEETLAAIDLYGVTSTFMVPTHLERIMALRRRTLARYDLSSIRLLAHAGAPIRESTKRAVLELFPAGSVWEFYGSTEGQGSRISAHEWLRKPTSVGRPFSGAAIEIRDDQGGPLDPGTVGQVWIRDPAADRFSYWGDRASTKKAWDGDAFTVGDLGYVDSDGYLFLTGRAHDIVITGGVNVYPQEVERVLETHPAVAQALVYGIPDEEWGEQLRALVVGSFGQPLDGDLLRSWAKERLAPPKVPKLIEIVDELPLTPFGKPSRRLAADLSPDEP